MKTNASDTSPDFARYLARAAAVLVAGIVAVTALVVVIDPYGLYGLVGPSRFNLVKPGLTRYQEQIKAARVLKVQPDFVILGNSRAEIGLDPKADAMWAAGGRGYNLAIAGTGSDTYARQMMRLKNDGMRPKTVILGVEFLDFLPSATAPVAAVSALPEPVSAAPASGAWQFDTLFSLASVKDAIRTLGIQHDSEAATMDLDGFNPLKEYGAYVRNDGFYKIFAQRAQENARAFHRKSTTALRPDDLKRLDSFLDTAVSLDADVKLVIYPYHAQILALFEEAGLWPSFEEWKRQVIEAVARTRRNHPGAHITLLDFSGFGTYNCERIPDRDEAGNVTRWYWEGGHFKKQLGDIVLARVMAPEAATPDAAFGFELVAGNERANRDRIAAERQACVSSAPGTFASARAAMERASNGP